MPDRRTLHVRKKTSPEPIGRGFFVVGLIRGDHNFNRVESDPAISKSPVYVLCLAVFDIDRWEAEHLRDIPLDLQQVVWISVVEILPGNPVFNKSDSHRWLFADGD